MSSNSLKITSINFFFLHSKLLEYIGEKLYKINN